MKTRFQSRFGQLPRVGWAAVTYYPAETFRVGPASPVVGTGGLAGTTWIIVRSIWRDGTLDQAQIRSTASGNVKIKIFRRSGRVLTWIAEQTVAVVSGLNTVTLNLSVLAGDCIGFYSATANTTFYTGVASPSGTEYYSVAGDNTTTLTVGAATRPSFTERFEINFRISTPATVTSNVVGNLLYLGPNTPAAGSIPNAVVSSALFERNPFKAPMRIETITLHATAAGLVQIHIMQPTTNGQSLLRSFVLVLASGENNLVAGTDFPVDVVVPIGGAIGFWPLTTALSSDAFNARTYRVLDSASTDGIFPKNTEMGSGSFSADTGSQSAQIKFGLRKTAAVVPSATVYDWTFGSAIHLHFDSTGWSVSGGVATNGANVGLANSLVYRYGSYCDGDGIANFRFTTASDNLCVFRKPYVVADNVGTLFQLSKDAGGTVKISQRGNWDGSTTMPAETASKITTVPFATATDYTATMTKSGTTVTLTITDGTNSDSLSFSCHGSGTSYSVGSGTGIGKFGVCAVAGTINIQRLRFTGTKSAPTLIIFGDSNTESSGATTDANGFAYRIINALATSGNGYVAAVSGTGSANVLARIEEEGWLWLPRDMAISIGTNDTNTTTFANNIAESASRISNAGANFYIFTVPPEAADTNPELVMNPALKAAYPTKYIDIAAAITTLRTGLAVNLIGAYKTDSLHYSDAGTAVILTEAQTAQPAMFV